MLSPLWTLLALAAYVGLLFLIAARGDQIGVRLDHPARRRLIYTLGLGVYCTSWTFFGAVGETARNGWDYLPIYLGPALIFLFLFPVIRRMVRVGQTQETASVADFLSARYGKSSAIAALSAGILVLAALPYIALQLRSAEAALGLITTIPPGLDIAGLAAIAFAAFSILFGARKPETSAANPGLSLAVAVESLIKLIAMMAVGGLALALLMRPDTPALEISPLSEQPVDFRFIVLTALAGLAALSLPRQFHMMVVENRSADEVRFARFGFPVFLLGVAIAAPPIAMAGLTVLPGTNPDAFIIALPIEEGSSTLALLALLGGFSAAAGMVTVATLALSVMIVNDWLGPFVLRRETSRSAEGLANRLLMWRRVVILAIMGAAYLVHLSLAGPTGLASIGLIAFAGAAQLAPSLLFGLYWPRANRWGAFAGLSTGAIGWILLIFVPAYTGYTPLPATGLDAFSLAVVLTLALNTLAFVVAVAFSRTGLVDRLQAEAFTRSARRHRDDATGVSGARLADIETLFVRVLGREAAIDALAELSRGLGRELRPNDPVTAAMAELAETRLARAVGSASARLLMRRVATGGTVAPDEVIDLIDETAAKIRTSEDARAETERSARFYTDHVPALLSYADRDYRLIFANQPYLDFFGLERSILGQSMAEYMSESEFAARWAYMERALSGERQEFDISRKDSRGRKRIWQLVYQPRIENGEVLGFYGVYQDVTARREAEIGLKRAYETLEDKVEERTAELDAARAEAEAATQSKTRFLAAASHDLLQPLSAARLLVASLEQDLKDAPQATRDLANRIDRSIENADQLLRALLDISRLDASGIQPDISEFALQPMFEDLVSQFQPKATAKGLEIVLVQTVLGTRTDRGLLASLLQNLVANAVRYTESGRVLIGVRRRGHDIVIQIHDTGPGMDKTLKNRIFQEFERGPSGQQSDRGLGLGLAIVDRISRQLGIPITVHSAPGQGSCFEAVVPRAEAQVRPKRRRQSSASLEGLYILYIDNEPDMLEAGLALLRRWGCHVVGARTQAEALAVDFGGQGPDIIVLDYHLDDGVLGPHVYTSLNNAYGRSIPGLLVTADRGNDPETAANELGLVLMRKPVAPAALRASLGALKRRLR